MAVVDARSREQVTDDEQSVDRTEPATTPAGPARRDRRGVVLAWALSVLLVAALAGLVLAVVAERQQAARTDARNAVMHAGRQVAVDFTTYQYQTWDADVNRVLAGATGPFKEEFTSASTSVKAQVVANQASSAGEVLEAAIVSMDADSAQVLVVADAVVKNTAVKDGQRRHYRMKLEMVRTGDAWLAADLQAVG